MQLRFRHLSLFVLLGSLTAFASSCSGPGNTGRTPLSDALVEQVPWMTGHPPIIGESGAPIVPTTPQFPSIATGMPDPGPQHDIDCSVLDDLEFSSFWFDTFEPVTGNWGSGQAYATYDDKTQGSFTMPGGANWYTGITTDAIWGLPADRIERGPACDGAPNQWAMHFKGGRYNRFGAGLEHPVNYLERPCDPAWGVCPPEPGPDDTKNSIGIPIQNEDGSPLAQGKFYWDLSKWDGISFWARRGPEGQGSMSAVLFDKHTSDALNREVDTFCRRVKPCRTVCVNGAECTLDPSQPSPVNPDGVYRCFDREDMEQFPGELGYPPAQLEIMYPPCGETACTSASDYLDPQFDGKECQPFTFDTHESAEFCFDEGDLDPPSSGSRCGDGYSKPVTVTTEWKFYKIPFSEMRQQGFGQVSPEMDLTSVNQISFIFFVGWVDTYLDNISLYRESD